MFQRQALKAVSFANPGVIWSVGLVLLVPFAFRLLSAISGFGFDFTSRLWLSLRLIASLRKYTLVIPLQIGLNCDFLKMKSV